MPRPAESATDFAVTEFCSYCGRLGGDTPFRVCATCGLGVYLRTDARALHADGAPFLVVRADGVISAASATAEREIPHDGSLVGRPLLALFTSEDDLEGAVALAAGGATDVASMSVTPRHGGRSVRVTIAPCGEPPAALIAVTRKPAATARS